MPSIDPTSDPVVALLDKAVRSDQAAAFLNDVVARVTEKLAAAPYPGMGASEVVPLTLFGKGLPETIKSAIVSVIDPGTEGGEESQPGRLQWWFTLSGAGAFEVEEGGEWIRHEMSDQTGARWMLITHNAWFMEGLGERPWVRIIFSMVDARDLLTMAPWDPEDFGDSTEPHQHEEPE